MKKYFVLAFLFLSITFSGLLKINASYAAVSNSVVYKFSVTIPPHVEPTFVTSQEKSSSTSGNSDISTQKSEQQTVIEYAQRGQETITLQTVTLK